MKSMRQYALSIACLAPLLLCLTPLPSSAQELKGLNENALFLQKEYKEGFDRIHAFIWVEWMGDESTQVSLLNKEVDALFSFLEGFEADYSREAFNAIIKWSHEDYEDDNKAFLRKMEYVNLENLLEIRAEWSMVLYDYNEQIEKKKP